MLLPAGLRRLSIAHASKLAFSGAACLTRLTNLVKLEFELCGDVVPPWEKLDFKLPAPMWMVSSMTVATLVSLCQQQCCAVDDSRVLSMTCVAGAVSSNLMRLMEHTCMRLYTVAREAVVFW
jgi:hypothetical protein